MVNCILAYQCSKQVSEARDFPPLRSEGRLEIQGRPQFGHPCLQAQLNVSIRLTDLVSLRSEDRNKCGGVGGLYLMGSGCRPPSGRILQWPPLGA
ncbi:hypothetical protein E2C01_006424 [Portunus trituberculatus]|uniref:Uncharacterized protein n=1 Tax=Portunus trituberculatus TaxID=210409 RepID=A0A5B7CW96_PORTR|nr:hypothetical protein [Portunus trituberculatus]